ASVAGESVSESSTSHFISSGHTTKQPTLGSYSPLLTMGSQLLELDHLLQLPLEEFIEGIKGMQDDQNHSKDHHSNLPNQSR
ncbi:unnamed protein product, partial [Musa acuminata var. zebrina]